MSVGYDAFDDPYCYKGTTTLKNKLGLRDPALLEVIRTGNDYAARKRNLAGWRI